LERVRVQKPLSAAHHFTHEQIFFCSRTGASFFRNALDTMPLVAQRASAPAAFLASAALLAVPTILYVLGAGSGAAGKRRRRRRMDVTSTIDDDEAEDNHGESGFAGRATGAMHMLETAVVKALTAGRELYG
jgi:hypothetical protein